MYNFDYVKPGSVDEAVAALADEDAQAISGGQTLIPTLKQRLAAPSKLVDLTGIAALKGIEISGDAVLIKGATTHGVVATSSEVAAKIPALASLAGRIGDPQVRNRGTMGGSIANDDPSACWPAAVLGLGATVITNKREIPADEFFLGMFTTALEEGEIVTAARFPAPEKARYEKMIQPASRFPLTAVFVAKTAEGPRVAVTGASSEGVFRWSEGEQALASDWSASAVDAVSPPSAEGMINDIHGSGEYRAHLVKVLTKRAVAAA